MKKNPLVLIVDDDDDFRNRVIPECLIDDLSVPKDRILTAKDVHSGVRIAAHHDPESADPIGLMIIDMHMSADSQKIAILEDAGVQLIRTVKFLNAHVSECGVIVFTAFPGYRNCMAAMKAGADAYIPKSIIEGYGEKSGGIEHLQEESARLLGKKRGYKKETNPTNDWLSVNGDWLKGKFGGKWVAFLDTVTARQNGFANEELFPEKDGLVIVKGESFKDVRSLVIASPQVLMQAPSIVKIRPITAATSVTRKEN